MTTILIVGINFHPELTGIGKYTGELASYLAEHNHQVRVVTAPPYYPQWKTQTPYRSWQYHSETWRGVRVYRCPVWIPRQPTGFKRLVHLTSFALSSLPVLLAQVTLKPDVVLCLAPTLMSAPFALFLARLVGANAWLHVQDFEVDAAIKLGILSRSKALGRWASSLEKDLMAGFNCVSTISSQMIKRLLQKGVERDKTVYFPNWVDTRIIYPLSKDENPLYSEWSVGHEQCIIMYAGNMGLKQGLDTLIESAKRLQSFERIQFILCGEGVTRRALEAKAKGLENVHFKDLQPVGRLNHLLNLADVHVLTQRSGAADLVMPSKLSGMLASGKAVIASASQQTAVGEVVSETGVLVPPEDPDALAESIWKLAQDPAERIRLGQLGRCYVEEHWAKDKVLKQFLRDLAQL